jgi:DNA repair exonuclease SbcCD ATPase subunit
LEREAKLHGDFVRANKDNIPYTYEITGVKPHEPNQKELSKAKQLRADYQQSLLKLSSCEATIKEKTSALERLRAELVEKELELKDAGELIDLTDKRKEIFDEECKLNKLVQTQTELNTQLTNKEKEIVAAEAKIETNKNNLVRVAKAIADINAQLKREDYNGKLLKSVRDAKPRVLNLVWSRVLDYTEQTFSEMRNVKSSIAKTEKEFIIDQRPVSRLSGSAKSILGISLRAAVRDIFAPTAGFMIFDEIFADCDEERTAAALAAIQTIRGQKFIVTHESQSEMAADQVVEI